MALTSGRPEVVVGLIDGSVLKQHPELVGATIREISGELSGQCVETGSTACVHGRYPVQLPQIWQQQSLRALMQAHGY